MKIDFTDQEVRIEKQKKNKSCFYSRSSTDDDELVSCSEVTRSVSSGVRECVLVQEVLRIQCERIIKYFEMLSRWPAAFVIFVVTWSSTHQAQARIISAFLYNDMPLSLDTKLRREFICIRLPNSSQKKAMNHHTVPSVNFHLTFRNQNALAAYPSKQMLRTKNIDPSAWPSSHLSAMGNVKTAHTNNKPVVYVPHV